MDIRLPDGTVLKNIPEGTSREEILTTLEGSGYDVSLLEPLTYKEKIVQGLRDPADALAQVIEHMVPEKARSYLNDLNNRLADLGLTGKLPPEGLDKLLQEQEKRYQTRRSAGGEEGIDWWRLGGATLGGAPLVAAVPNPWVAGALLGMVAQSETSPEALDDFWETKAKQAALGAVTVGAGKVAGRMIKPKVDPDVAKLKQEGIRMTPGQMIGPWAAGIEERSTSLPLAAVGIKHGQTMAIKDFNRVVLQKALDPIKVKLPKDVRIGYEAVDWAGEALSKAYEDILPKLAARKDKVFNSELKTIQGMVNTLPDAERKQFNRILKEQVFDKFTKPGLASGETIKQIESTLGRLSRGYTRDAAFDKRQLGSAIREVQSSLRDLVQRQNPMYADQLQKINLGYAIFLRAERAATYLGAKDGVFTPDQFNSAVKALDPSLRHRSFGRGKALMQDLAGTSSRVLSKKLPSSGTAERLVGVGLIGGGYAVHPGLAAAELSLLAPYYGKGRDLAQWLLTGRQGPTWQALSEIPRRAGPLAVPAVLGVAPDVRGQGFEEGLEEPYPEEGTGGY